MGKEIQKKSSFLARRFGTDGSDGVRKKGKEVSVSTERNPPAREPEDQRPFLSKRFDIEGTVNPLVSRYIEKAHSSQAAAIRAEADRNHAAVERELSEQRYRDRAIELKAADINANSALFEADRRNLEVQRNKFLDEKRFELESLELDKQIKELSDDDEKEEPEKVGAELLAEKRQQKEDEFAELELNAEFERKIKERAWGKKLDDMEALNNLFRDRYTAVHDAKEDYLRKCKSGDEEFSVEVISDFDDEMKRIKNWYVHEKAQMK